MGGVHCRRLHGFTLLLVVFVSSVFGLASTIDVSIYRDRKRMLSNNPEEHTMCAFNAEAKDGKSRPLNFDCEKGYVIKKIDYVDYGRATGDCGKFRRGDCGSSDALSIVEKKCIGKNGCELFVPDKIYGPTHCKGRVKLVIEATCKKA